MCCVRRPAVGESAPMGESQENSCKASSSSSAAGEAQRVKQARRLTYLKGRRPLSSAEVLARRMRAEEIARILGLEERSYFLPTGWGSSKHGPGGQSKR